MELNRKAKLTKLTARRKNQKPEPVVVDMSEVAETIAKLTETVEAVVKQRESDTEAFSEHLTRLEGIVKGALERDSIAPLKDALEKIKIVSNFKPDITLPKFDVPTPQVKIVNTNDDIYDTYKASDQDVDEPMSYYGFVDKNGRWFILRQTGDDQANFRYAFGQSDYTKAWKTRAALEYGRYDES